MTEEIQARYIGYYKKMHERGAFAGGSLKYDYVDSIKGLVDRTRSRTLLDFGCGKAAHYHNDNPINEKFGIDRKNISFYDPAVPEYEKMPEGTFDGVICTDVLEHVPESFLAETIAAIFNRADRFVFLVVNCGLAVKKLPNGENAHVTVQTPAWWNRQFKPHYDTKRIVHLRYLIPEDPVLNILKL